MSLIQGFQSTLPCPICLVQAGEQPDLSKTFTLHTQESFQHTLASIANLLKTAAEDKLWGEFGLCNIKVSSMIRLISLTLNSCLCSQNAFWTVPYSDPHQVLTFDRMHNNSHGLGGKHLWPLLQEALERLGPDPMTKVDKQ
jgi:hypothetical protein